MLVWGRRANTGLLVSENAGWVCGVGWVLQGGLRWPEPGVTFRLVSANSSSTGERKKQEGEAMLPGTDSGKRPDRSSQSYGRWQSRNSPRRLRGSHSRGQASQAPQTPLVQVQGSCDLVSSTMILV